jgi:hypothetical protein
MRKTFFLIAAIAFASCGDSTKPEANTSASQTTDQKSDASTPRQYVVESYFAAVAPDNNWSLILNASYEGTFPVQFTTKDGISVSVPLLKKAIIEADEKGKAVSTVSSNEQKFTGKVINGDGSIDNLEVSVISRECIDNAGVKHLASCTINYKEKTYEGCGEYK